MSPNTPKNGLDGFAKNEIIGHEMALSRAILVQILAILRISDQKNDQPFFRRKIVSPPWKIVRST